MPKQDPGRNNSASTQIKALYKDHAEFPYISPERDLDTWLKEVEIGRSRPVAKRQMIRTAEGLLPGHIILLWRVSLGTYTLDTWISKYFEYDYGINGQDIDWLHEEGYVRIQTAVESLDLITSPQLKKWLKEKGIKGYSKLKKEELLQSVKSHYSQAELARRYDQRRYVLTSKGEEALAANEAIVDRHPKKQL